jgi:transposase-like protein
MSLNPDLFNDEKRQELVDDLLTRNHKDVAKKFCINEAVLNDWINHQPERHAIWAKMKGVKSW